MKTSSSRFSLFYFFSVSIFSFILAFFPIHCRNIGLSPLEIAIVTAFGTLATVIAAPIALQSTHYLISTRKLFSACLIFGFIFYLPLFRVESFYPAIFAWLLFNLVKRGADAIIDAHAIRIAKSQKTQFETMRMWGSIGFVITTVIFGFAVDKFGQEIIIPLGAVYVLLIAISGIPLRQDLPANTGREENLKDQEDSNEAKNFVPLFTAVIICFSFITASHSSLYIYFSLYLEALGWSASTTSLAWNIGVIGEILIFMNFRYLEKYLGLYGTLVLSCFLTCIRWIVLSYFQMTPVILLSQFLHGFSFGGCYICAAKLVPKILPNRLADRGQGIMIALGFGLGSFLGRGLSGYLAKDLQEYQTANTLFHSSVILSGISLILAIFLLMKDKTDKV